MRGRGRRACAPSDPAIHAEHEEFRSVGPPLRADRARPARAGVGGRPVVSQRGVRAARRARLHRPEVPGRATAATTIPVADAVFVEELAWCGSGGLAAGIGAHCGIALPPIWRFGTEDQKQRYLVPGIRGEKIAALAITEPDAGSDVASIRTLRAQGRRRLRRQRIEDVHHRRRARRRARHRGQDDAGGWSPRPLVPDHRARPRRRVERAREARLARLRHRRDPRSTTCSCPRRTCSAQENGGFYLIMANFQWERLLMALGAVGAMKVAFEKHARVRPAAPGVRQADRRTIR